MTQAYLIAAFNYILLLSLLVIVWRGAIQDKVFSKRNIIIAIILLFIEFILMGTTIYQIVIAFREGSCADCDRSLLETDVIMVHFVQEMNQLQIVCLYIYYGFNGKLDSNTTQIMIDIK